MKPINRVMYATHWDNLERAPKLAESERIILEWLEQVERPRIAFSGGKDSTALLILLQRLGVMDIPIVSLTSDIWMPDLAEHCAATTKAMGFTNPHIVEAYDSILERLGDPEVDLGELVKLENRALYDFDVKNGIDGVMTGLRMDESRGRKLNYNIRGSIYVKRNAVKYEAELEQLYCTPLSKWSGTDVMAAIIGTGTPYFHVYDNDEDGHMPHERRVGWMVSPKRYDTGAVSELRLEYPEAFAKVVAANPLLSRMA